MYVSRNTWLYISNHDKFIFPELIQFFAHWNIWVRAERELQTVLIADIVDQLASYRKSSLDLCLLAITGMEFFLLPLYITSPLEQSLLMTPRLLKNYRSYLRCFIASDLTTNPWKTSWLIWTYCLLFTTPPSVSSTLMNFVPFRHGHIIWWCSSSVGQWSVHFWVHCSSVSRANC